MDGGTGRAAVYDYEKEKRDNVVGLRIQAARQRMNLSITELTEQMTRLGFQLTRQAVGKWESGATVPSAYQLLAISRLLGIENPLDYFTSDGAAVEELSSEGLSRLREYREMLIASGRFRQRPAPPPVKKKVQYVEKPVSELSVSAGLGEPLSDGIYSMIRVPASTVPDKASIGVRVNGDSMEPTYLDGTLVWVQYCKELRPGEIGVFILNGEGYMKIYDEQEPDEDVEPDSYGQIPMQPVLFSINEKYAPIVVTQYDDFRIVGRVL